MEMIVDPRVCMAQASLPSLDADNNIASRKDPETHCLLHSPLHPLVHVLLPVGLFEVWLLLGEYERIYATVKVRILLVGQHISRS